MQSLNTIKFYLTHAIYKELLSTYAWAKRIVFKKHKPIHVSLSLALLYPGAVIGCGTQYARIKPTPNGLDPLLTEDQVMLLIQSSSLIGLPELSHLATSMHEENKQNKL